MKPQNQDQPVLSDNHDPIEALLRIPKSSLEHRVKALEEAIDFRENIRDRLLTAWGTRTLLLTDRLFRLRYAQFIPKGIEQHQSCESELLHIQELMAKENLNSFADILKLYEKLLTMREELELEIEKQRLVGSQL